MGSILLVTDLALKALKGNIRFLSIFCLNITIGLLGLVQVISVKNHMNNSISSRSKDLSTADIIIQSNQIPSNEFIAKVQKILKDKLLATSTMISMFSMVEFKDTSDNLASQSQTPSNQFCQLLFVDEKYPLYGLIKLSDESDLKDFVKNNSTNSVAMLNDDFKKFQLASDSMVAINEHFFNVNAAIKESSDYRGMMSRLAPKIYIPIDFLAKLDLVKFGSKITVDYMLKIDSKYHDPKNIKNITDKLKNAFNDPAISVSSHYEFSDQSSNLFELITRYLNLISLIAFFLSSVGACFLFRIYLSRKIKELAVYVSLGFSKLRALSVVFLELIFISMISVLASMAIAYVFSKCFGVFGDNLPESFADLGFFLSFLDVLVLLFLAMFCAISLSIPTILGIIKTPSSVLLKKTNSSSSNQFKYSTSFWTNSMIYLSLVLFYIAICLVKSGSMLVSVVFIISFIFYLLLLVLICYLIHFLIKKLSKVVVLKYHYSNPLALALMWLNRGSFYFKTAFVAIACCVALISVVGILSNSLLISLNNPDISRADYFLLDIQSDQLSELVTLFDDNDPDGNYLSFLSAPFIVAKHISTNGKVPKDKQNKIRNFRYSSDFNNNSVRLSYSSKLKKSEYIVEGEYFYDKYYDKNKNESMAEISLEKNYAKRNNLKMDDTLSFSSAGFSLQGRVTSIREVDFMSFEPNFFIQFQPRAIEHIPHSFIGTLKLSNNFDPHTLILEISKKYPNIAIIHIKSAVDLISSIVKTFSLCLVLITFLVLICGFFILGSIIYHSVILKQKNISLLSVLGLKQKTIVSSIVYEFAMISISASIIGCILAIVISNVFAKFILKMDHVYNSYLLTGIIAVMTVSLSCFISIFIVSKLLNKVLTKSLFSQNS